MSPKPKQDDPAQSKRFIETAREIGADESGEAFERAFKKMVPPKMVARRAQNAPAKARRK